MDWKKYGEWRRTVYPEISYVYYGQLLPEFLRELEPEKLIHAPHIKGFGQSPWQKRPYEILYGYKFLPGTFSIGIKEWETFEKKLVTKNICLN